jgi:hypothetical protein
MKPSKPEDREESWLRKMADRLPHRRNVPKFKEAEDEPEDVYEDDDVEGDVEGEVTKPRKKRKKKKNPKANDESVIGCFIILILFAFAVWFLFFN